jgi:hypothetical protein
MKKNIISTVIAAALCAATGSAIAAPVVTDSATVTTAVRSVSSATVSVTPVDGSVTTDEVKQAGTKVAAVTLDASGLYDGPTGANISLSVGKSNYNADTQKWNFISADGSQRFSVLPVVPSGWNFNGDSISKRINGETELASLNIDFETVAGNGNVQPGNYSMPVEMTFGVW